MKGDGYVVSRSETAEADRLIFRAHVLLCKVTRKDGYDHAWGRWIEEVQPISERPVGRIAIPALRKQFQRHHPERSVGGSRMPPHCGQSDPSLWRP